MRGWSLLAQDGSLRRDLLHVHRRRYEIGLVAVLGVGLGLLALGGLGVLAIGGASRLPLDPGTLLRIGVLLASVGTVFVVIAQAMSYPIDRLRTVGIAESGGDRYDRMRRWSRLKVLTTLLTFLLGAAIVTLGASLATRMGLIEASTWSWLPAQTFLHGPVLMVLGLFAVAAVTHLSSLRAPMEADSSDLQGVFLALAVAFTVLFAGIAAALAMWEFDAGLLASLDAHHAPFVLLAAASSGALALFAARSLPTLRYIATEQHHYYRGRHISRTRSIVLPVSIALGLLFAMVLGVVIFQLSVTGLVQELPTNTVLLSVVGVILALIVVSLVSTVLVSRKTSEHPLFTRKRSQLETQERWILGVSLSVAAVFFVAAIILLARGRLWGVNLDAMRWLDLLGLGLLLALGPYGFYYRAKQKRVRKLEARFPDFLRDLAASRRAGLTLDRGVKIAARGDYGELTPEIIKMADQLAWNIPFREALDDFAERADTPLVRRASSLINEASRSGGQVTDVMETAAKDAREIKTLADERRMTMKLYTGIVYVAFFVFLGVAAVLYGTFIPEVVTASAANAGTTTSSISGLEGIEFGGLQMADYRTFYFVAAVAQGLGNGLVAGLMETGRVRSGLVHAFLMVLTAYLTFGLFLT